MHSYCLNTPLKGLLLISFVLVTPLCRSDKTNAEGVMMAQESFVLQLDKNSYVGGDIVQGSVIMSAAAESSCRLLTVAIGWEARSRKSVESWYSEPLMPDAPATFQANLAIPAKAVSSFQATYHSINWRVTIRISLPGIPNIEEDFIFLIMP